MEKNEGKKLYPLYANFYPRIFSSLSREKGELLCALVDSGKLSLVSWANSLDEIEGKIPEKREDVDKVKKKHLEGLLSGVSLDYMEAISDAFFLEKFSEKKDYVEMNVYLILAEKPDGKAPRTFGDFFHILEELGGKLDTKLQIGFVTHKLKGDYVLLGKKKPDDELVEIHKHIGLD